MSLPRKFYAELSTEIKGWEQESLITSDQARILLDRYPLPANAGSRLVSIVINIGAVLVGLGTILFFAANWHTLGSFLKVVLILTSIGASDYFGWKFKYGSGTRPKLGAALLLLGSIFFGSAIWLITQTFNYQVSPSLGLFLWALGTTAKTIVTGSELTAVLSTLLIAAWTTITTVESASHNTNWSLTLFDWLRFGGSFTISLLLAFFVRSPWSVAITLIGGGAWITLPAASFDYGGALYGIVIFGGWLYNRMRWQNLDKPFLYVGSIMALSNMLLMTCNRGWFTDHSAGLPTLVGLLSAVAGVAWLISKKDQDAYLEVWGLVAIAAMLFGISFATNEPLRLGVSNFALTTSLIGLIVAGSRRLQSPAVVNIAVVFFVLDIIFRYFDMFYSMLDRSVFFIAGGIILMGAGAIAERGRRKLIEGINATA